MTRDDSWGNFSALNGTIEADDMPIGVGKQSTLGAEIERDNARPAERFDPPPLNMVTDKGTKVVCQMTGLTELHLDETAVGDAGVSKCRIVK